MKGIYLTAKAKQEIKTKIAELEKEQKTEGEVLYIIGKAMINTYKEILQSAAILPVEENWEDVNYLYDGVRKELFPKGVIIQPKQ
jgi:hypothetical protein